MYVRARCLLLLIALLALAGGARAQDVEPRFDAAKVPADGARIEDFIPRSWKVGQKLTGDLNGDARPDTVVQLVPADYPDEPAVSDAAPPDQALLILLATDNGRLHRAGLAAKLLDTDGPQYILDLSIKNGVLVVHQNYGMSDVVDLTHRFRYDPTAARFQLIGRDSFIYTRPLSDDTEKVSENYLTGVRLTTTGHFSRKSAIVRETTARARIPVKKVYFEDVSERTE